MSSDCKTYSESEANSFVHPLLLIKTKHHDPNFGLQLKCLKSAFKGRGEKHKPTSAFGSSLLNPIEKTTLDPILGNPHPINKLQIQIQKINKWKHKSESED